MAKKIFLLFVALLTSALIIYLFIFNSKAAGIKANIVIDGRKIVAPLPYNWQAFAQGGEEQGVSMFRNIIPQTQELVPRYIRIDHIYDGYDLVSKLSDGQLSYDWTQLDQTVCDIYETG